MRILLKGPLNTITGYGNDVVGLAEAFAAVGIDVHLKPSDVVPPIDRLTAALLTKFPEMPFDLGIVYFDPSNLDAHDVGRACNKTIAWTMWEYESYDDSVHNYLGSAATKRPLRERLKEFDLLLVTDDTSMAALGPHAAAAGTPVKKLAGGFRSKQWKAAKRDWNARPFRFGMLGRLDRRKGPWISIGAFTSLKAQYGDDFDAELILKTTLPGLEQVPHPDIKPLMAWWTHEQVQEFYGSLHCFLAPSSGEGKNVPALEAMATGIPVMATNYGGHTEWLGDEWSYALPYDLFPYEHGKAAKVLVADLAERMLHVYKNRAELRRKGEVAQSVIPAMCDWEKVVHRLLALPELR